MKIRVKKNLLQEQIQQDLGYTDIEGVRITNGVAIDRVVLTPEDGSQMNKDSEDPKELSQRDYINRIRDVVKGGREVPYLYYAYKGIDDKGNIKNDNDISPVLNLQFKKASQLIEKLRFEGDASVSMFLCDFGRLMSLHEEWDKEYEKKMLDILPSKTAEKMATKKGYDRTAYQAGPGTSLKPFSTVAIGRGSKPVYHQNVDFMYKTSPEPNLNVEQSDLWAFSIRVPLTIAYISLTDMDMPQKPSRSLRDYEQLIQKYRTQRRDVLQSRSSFPPSKISEAYNHWNQNEQKYRTEYAKKMQQEPGSWSEFVETSKLADMLKLSFDQFDTNYVESDRQAKKGQDTLAPTWAMETTPEFKFVVMLLQQAPLKEETYEGLIDQLGKSDVAKRIAKTILGKMIQDKNTTIKSNIGKNLQVLVSSYGDRPEVKKNLPWMQEAIQQYYIMGGK